MVVVMDSISSVSINTPLLSNDEVVVGLDISTVSTGVAVLSNQGIKVANIDVSHAASKNDVFETIKRRLSLEKQLSDMLDGLGIKWLVVEDVFMGTNATTYKELVNLNNVPDELLVKGILRTTQPIEDVLVRVQSRVWKSWIRPKIQDQGGIIHDGGRYLSDKQVVRQSLSAWGINPDSLGGGKGNQDRCDAFGMAFGLIINKEDSEGESGRDGEAEGGDGAREGTESPLSAFEMWYQKDLKDDPSFKDALHGRQETVLSKVEFNRVVTQGYDSFKKWLDDTATDASRVFIVPNASLGALGKKLGFSVVWGGADFAFCRKGR
jgi:hypothetical protein